MKYKQHFGCFALVDIYIIHKTYIRFMVRFPSQEIYKSFPEGLNRRMEWRGVLSLVTNLLGRNESVRSKQMVRTLQESLRSRLDP